MIVLIVSAQSRISAIVVKNAAIAMPCKVIHASMVFNNLTFELFNLSGFDYAMPVFFNFVYQMQTTGDVIF